MFGRNKSPEADKKMPLSAKIGTYGAAALLLIGCGNKVDATDGPAPTSSPAVVETTPNTTPDVTLAPSSTVDIPSTSSEAPTSNSETEAPVDQKLYVENTDGTVSFPVEAYRDNPEQLVTDFIEVGLTNWINAGATPEQIEEINASTTDTPSQIAALEALAEANTAKHADALFANWQNDAPLTTTVGKFTAANAYMLQLYSRSLGVLKYYNGPVGAAGDPYHVQLLAKGVDITEQGSPDNPVVQSKVTPTFKTNFLESSIRDHNNPGSNFDPVEVIDGTTIRSDFVTFNNVDGVYKATFWVDYTQ